MEIAKEIMENEEVVVVAENVTKAKSGKGWVIAGAVTLLVCGVVAAKKHLDKRKAAAEEAKDYSDGDIDTDAADIAD